MYTLIKLIAAAFIAGVYFVIFALLRAAKDGDEVMDRHYYSEMANLRNHRK